MRILKSASALAAAAAILAGCVDQPPAQARFSDALPGMPLPPAATVIARSGSEDALQVTFRSAWTQDSMATYYRAVLSTEPWSLVSDTRTRDGVITLYAEREGPPLWVIVRPDSAAPGSIVSLGGAVIRAPGDTVPPQADTTTPS